MAPVTKEAPPAQEDPVGGVRFALLYDPDCCFCADFARWVRHRAPDVEAVTFQDPRARRWVPEEAKLRSSFHLVASGGSVESGPEALPRLAELTVGRAAGALLRLCPAPALRWAYRWVSERRWNTPPSSP